MFAATTKEDTVHAIKSPTSSNVNEAANDAKRDLRATANEAGKKVRSFIDNAGDEISHVTDQVKGQIKDKPVQASLIALGAGFVLGLLYRR